MLFLEYVRNHLVVFTRFLCAKPKVHHVFFNAIVLSQLGLVETFEIMYFFSESLDLWIVQLTKPLF